MNFLKKLTHYVDHHIQNANNEIIGCIKGVIKNDGFPEYIILSCDQFIGNGKRYFAIPAFPAFIQEDEKKGLLLTIEPEDLILAKRININQCPRVMGNNFFQSIYEIYGYDESTEITVAQ